MTPPSLCLPRDPNMRHEIDELVRDAGYVEDAVAAYHELDAGITWRRRAPRRARGGAR